MKFSLLFGGVSFEHEISIVSAISLKKVLNDKIANFIFLDSNHEFFLIPSEYMNTKTFSKGEYKKFQKLQLSLGGFYKFGFFGSKPLSDCGVIINTIHGGDGEDGHIAAVLDFSRVAYIGPRIEASALSFNKRLTKIYANEVGVKVLPYEFFDNEDNAEPKTNIPYIIKPSRLGSSLGVSVVKDKQDLQYALDSAFGFDSEVIVEPFYAGVKEYNLAGFKDENGEFRFSIIEEPKKNEMLEFDDKYLDFSRSEQVNKADVSNELESKLKEAFKKVYANIFNGALIRCDFFVIDGEVYLNEINPVPGSMANYLFSDFSLELEKLAKSLKPSKAIKVSYKYVDQIQKAKGK